MLVDIYTCMYVCMYVCSRMYISRSTKVMSRTTAVCILVLVIFGTLTSANEVSNLICPIKSSKASIFGFDDSVCQLGAVDFDYSVGLIEMAKAATGIPVSPLHQSPRVDFPQVLTIDPSAFSTIQVIDPSAFSTIQVGDETSLQKALSIIDTNTHEYVVVLFYASWCPFSTILKPLLSTMSVLYPSIPHFAIEESFVKPSILSKYGVNGFPTLFVLNATMRARYIGPRTLSSLVDFYMDVTGVEGDLVDKMSIETMDSFVHEEGNNSSEADFCPFSWAKSPENILRQETYLALATLFVIFRSLYLIYPFIITSAQYAQRTQFLNIQIRILWEHPFAYLNRAIQLFISLTGCLGIGFFHERKH